MTAAASKMLLANGDGDEDPEGRLRKYMVQLEVSDRQLGRRDDGQARRDCCVRHVSRLINKR